MTFGDEPSQEIDHIDRNPLNNAIVNLRKASHSENRMNIGTRANNTSGVTGVDFPKRDKRWRARITKNREVMTLGHFATKEEAIIARENAAKIIHGAFIPAQDSATS